MVIIKGNLTGQTRDSKSCGKFDVLEYFGNCKYLIRFVNTGTTKIVFSQNICSGRITDEAVLNNLGKYRLGDILHSDKFGEAEIIDIIKKERKTQKGSKFRNYVKVRFLDTGYIVECDPINFKRNKVRDNLKPSVQNVGMLGYTSHIEGRLRDLKEYRLWEGILLRCYGVEDYSRTDSSYRLSEVEERWKRFDFFLEDIVQVKNYDMWKRFHEEYPCVKNIFEIDKDILIENNKLYSLETCMFIPKFINAGYTTWANEETKEKLKNELERLTYESIIEEARRRKLL